MYDILCFCASVRTSVGSIVGGARETLEMLDFCAARVIHPNIK